MAIFLIRQLKLLNPSFACVRRVHNKRLDKISAMFCIILVARKPYSLFIKNEDLNKPPRSKLRGIASSKFE